MSVSWGTQYAKLKTNLRLAANRLRLLQKKKTEQAMKARQEIADFLSTDKEDRARIRVESIIREDFVVEAYEILEMYCELLLARFGLIQQMKELDDGIAEAVSSLLWVAPRISHEVAEFKIINDQLQQKYGKQFAEAARMNQLPEPSRVSPKLLQKLSISAPSKILVEKYLIEIARCANLDFTPDPRVMRDDDDEIAAAERNLINFMSEERIGWSSGGRSSTIGGDGGNAGSNNFGGNPPQPPPPSQFSGGNVGGFPGGGTDGGGGGGMTDQTFFYPSSHPPTHQSNAPQHPRPQLQPQNTEYEQPQPPAAFQPPSHVDGLPRSAPTTQHPQSKVYAQQPPTQHLGPRVMLSYKQNESLTQPSRKTSEHIYEIPPSISDDILSQFPEPPTDFPPVPANTGPSTTASKGADDGIDFDDLAKRFKELKKRF